MKEEIFMEHLNIIQKSSTCKRVQVAALLVKDDRIIATGKNGVTSGNTHCCDIFEYADENFSQLHHNFSVRYELHAEQNVISFCAKHGIATNNCTLYVSHSPCIHCAKIIFAAGISSVKYVERYDRDVSGIDFLIENNIECIQL
jgi:Deoxycytidylate deaminase